MKITSLEIKQHEFEKSFRGYDIEEVNHFLSNIATEWDRMLNESKMLKMQLDISEKEASKLREVEMTLIKTLRTAEDTSTRLTENAAAEGAKRIEEATQKAAQIVAEAENTAKLLVEEAEQKVSGINTTAKLEFSELENNFATLESKKKSLLEQIKSIADQANQVVSSNGLKVSSSNISFESNFKAEEQIISEPIEQEIFETENIAEEVNASENIEVAQEEELVEEAEIAANLNETIEEEEEHGISFSSAVNEISLDNNHDDKTNLEIIEGIGPKIKEVLNSARIVTFRDLATTPLYHIKDILDAAGPHFAAHDPSTWIEQALLAENGQWDKLEELKNYLEAGRVPKADLPVETPKVQESSDSHSTEEMLDKVNKVKAAIRKAMVEKGDKAAEPKEPKSINDYIAEKKQSGSFFDNLN